MLNFPLVDEGEFEVSWSMAKERMKWNSTSGLIGTSVNLTLLDSAPMYSRKRFEFAGAAWIDA